MSKVPEFQQQDTRLWQRGGASFLHIPSDDYPFRRLVCHTLEHGHFAEVSDYQRGFFCSDHGTVRTARKTY